ncbi:MAG: mechanosensitive ion channel [Ignavibacteria bacterium]|nr:mechanosensitive ion channel [Ignavibacteria bacterium]
MNINIVLVRYIVILTSVVLLQSFQLISQDKNTKDSTVKELQTLTGDTSGIKAIESLEKLFVGEIVKQNNEKRIKRLREEQIARIYSKLDDVSKYLSKGTDTARYNDIIRLAQSSYEITSDVLNIEDVNIMTPRNLTTSLLLNKELLRDLMIIDNEVSERINDITGLRKGLDSLGSDTIIFKIPKDTAQVAEYFRMMRKLSEDYNHSDTLLIQSLDGLNKIHSDISGSITRLNESIWQIENTRKKDELSFFSGTLAKKNYPFIWDFSAGNRPLSEAINYSSEKNLRVLVFYVFNNAFLILLVLVLSSVLYFILRKFRAKVTSIEDLKAKYGNSVFISNTFTVSLFLSFNILQFIMPRPPLVFTGLVWTLCGIMLLVLIRNRKDQKIKAVWLWILLLYILIFNSNLMLIVTIAERWFLLAFSAAAVFTAWKIKKQAAEFTSDKRWMRNILNICLAVFALSIITNITGYFNLTKLILITSVLTIYLSLLFYAVYIYLNEALLMLSEFSELDSGGSFSKSMLGLKSSFPKAARILLAAGGIILISRNFYLYDYFTGGLSIFLETKRTLGDFTIKIENILLFILITAISAIVSKLISLYSELKSSGLYSGKDERGGIGNWLLLIRIAVMSAGLLIAFVSSGFPLDKLTIIIGSLGVGIGLGLQSIVGNLFSGVFLAFEKPVKIGDQIEVDGKTGIIKEIGIRSSKLETFEGSDVIIPNGDLLTKHVINWTRKNNKRRADISLNVPAESDVKKCREVIMNLLDGNPQVDKTPTPQVLVEKLSDTGIEFRILFWTDINNYLQNKSEVFYSLQDALKFENADKPE